MAVLARQLVVFAGSSGGDGVVTNSQLAKCGMLCVAVSLVLAAIGLLFGSQIVRLCELTISSDQLISASGRRQLAWLYGFGDLFLLLLGVGLYKAKSPAWRSSLRRTFLHDPLCHDSARYMSPKWILVISSCGGMFLLLMMRCQNSFPLVHRVLYAKDHGLLDLFVPVSVLVSAMFLMFAAFRLKDSRSMAKGVQWVIRAWLLLAFVLIVLAGEETSWGQDFLGWQTPELFEGNIENQTNIHNYFNDSFDYMYVSLSFILVVMSLSAWQAFNRVGMPYTLWIMPHPSLLGLGILIALVSIAWYQEQELLEEMIALFMLLYSLRAYSSTYVSLAARHSRLGREH